MSTTIQRRHKRESTLAIASIDRRTSAGGVWVCGTVDGYRFNALVFAGHALDPDFEIGRSRISKLWIQRLADGRTVYNWDRGLDVPPADADVQAALDYLAVEIPERADRLFGW